MKNHLLIFIFISLSIQLVFSNAKDSIKKKPLVLPEQYKFNLGHDILPKIRKEKGAFGAYLSDKEINAIKEKAKDYEVSYIGHDEIAIMKTNKGYIKLKLFTDIAPKHCKNFKRLSNSTFYDGTKFHRVIKDFMIQGGDILSRDIDKTNDGTGDPGWTIDAEFNDRSHKRGTLSMARSSNPNSAGSQFFICVADCPWLDSKYTIFGEVLEGIGIVDKIVASETDRIQLLKKSFDIIPEGHDVNKYFSVLDPASRKKLFFLIPYDVKDINELKFKLKDKLKSNNPVAPITILSLRVE